MRTGRRQRGWGVALALLATGGVTIAGAAPAGAVAPGCAAVGAVFARGSGQPLGYREAPRFFQKLSARLGAAAVASYELGSGTYGGARYPAAGVGIDSTQEIINVLDAWTGVPGGTYRASVASGATELAAYVTERVAACPGERQVIGGYSQGAQTIGDGLARLAPTVRSRVAYVALFGDPRLWLPEGQGIFPPACRGGTRSPWRRGNVGCFTDNGILGARQPYVPSDLAGRTGSWCDRNDPICNNNIADLTHSTHSHYSDPGNGMDGAINEIATAVTV